MSRHIKDLSRSQATLFPEMLEDFVSKENTVRVIDVFDDGLDLEHLAKATGHHGYVGHLIKSYLQYSFIVITTI